jgi:hypothetical protein
MTAKEVLEKALSLSLIPLAKERRFKKSGRSFHRRLGTAVQLIHIQLSAGNAWDQTMFYVNVGLSFDELCLLAGEPPSEKPSESECEPAYRMRELVPSFPQRYTVTPESDPAVVADEIRPAFIAVMDELEKITSPGDFRKHSWFSKPAAPTVNPRVLYVCGDYDAAWAELQSVAETFKDRQGMSAKDLVKRLRLEELRSRLGP